MKHSPRTLAVFIFLPLSIVLLAILAFSLVSGKNTATNMNDRQESEAVQKSSGSDIENISVHIGLDIQCPDLLGVAQNGYVYTVMLRGNNAIERLGCGVGEPEVFAAAIAGDLMASGRFQELNTNQVLEKMTFKFYDLNTD